MERSIPEMDPKHGYGLCSYDDEWIVLDTARMKSFSSSDENILDFVHFKDVNLLIYKISCPIFAIRMDASLANRRIWKRIPQSEVKRKIHEAIEIQDERYFLLLF